VVLGQAGVGKSSIVLRYITDSFREDQEPTIGAAFLSKMILVGDTHVKFNIWDTAGQEKYHSLARMYYYDTSAVILVYDITSYESFEAMKKWYQEVSEHGPQDILVGIAGNKEDLVDQEEVDITEARAFAASVGAVFKKTSAKSNYGIEQLFKEIASKVNFQREALKKQQERIKLEATQENKDGCC